MYLIVFTVPESHLEIVKQALFNAKAGFHGNYSHCAWQTKGEGQFLPLPGSSPFIGTTNVVEYVEEFRVELICADEYIEAAINALKQAHPYEIPYYIVIKVEDFGAT